MPYVLYRDDGVIVALDEKGPQLIVTQYNAETETDDIIAHVPLPPNGIEVLDWSVGKRPSEEAQPPLSVTWDKRPDGAKAPRHPAWPRSA